jgi:hypothetical protein
VHANPGDFVVKPKSIPHTFWNAGPASCRFLEIISPPGLERLFSEAAAMMTPTGPRNPAERVALSDRYGMEVDLARVPSLETRYRVRLLGGPPPPTSPR